MKKIITSDSQFIITNALYESIKKNNPELLIEYMEADSNDVKLNKDAIPNGVALSDEFVEKFLNSDQNPNEIKKEIQSKKNKLKVKNKKENNKKEQKEKKDNKKDGFIDLVNGNLDAESVNFDYEQKMQNALIKEITDEYYLTSESLDTIIDIIDEKIKLLKNDQNGKNDTNINMVSLLEKIKKYINKFKDVGASLNENININEDNSKHNWTQQQQDEFNNVKKDGRGTFQKNAFFNEIRDFLKQKIGDYESIISGDDSLIEGLKDTIKERTILQIFNISELEKILSSMEEPLKGKTIPEKMDNAYDILKHDVEVIKKYTFESDVPKNILEFYKAVKNKINEQLYGSKFQVRFMNFGEKDYIGFMKDDIKEIYYNNINSSYDFIIPHTNIKLYDIYKEAIPSEEFWKNVAVIYANTNEGYRISQSKIGETLSSWQNLRIKSSRLVKNMNTNTQIFTLIDNNNYNYRNITDVKNRKDGQLFDEYTNEKEMNSDTKLIKRFQRFYFIVLTEGYFKKGEMLSKISDKIKNKFLNGNRKLGNLGIGDYN